jgi:hypothetical protein
MWADTLLDAERAHLFRLIAWGASSVLAGTALIAWLRVRGHRSPLLEQFATLTAAWGAIEIVLAFVARGSLMVRDQSAATRLDRLLWLNIGLDVGYVLVGLTLVIAGWRLGRRFRLVGAGIGVMVQGSALVLLHLLFATQIFR